MDYHQGSPDSRFRKTLKSRGTCLLAWLPGIEKTEAAEGPFAGEFIEVPMGDAAIHKLREAEDAALIASPMLEIIAPVNFV